VKSTYLLIVCCFICLSVWTCGQADVPPARGSNRGEHATGEWVYVRTLPDGTVNPGSYHRASCRLLREWVTPVQAVPKSRLPPGMFTPCTECNP